MELAITAGFEPASHGVEKIFVEAGNSLSDQRAVGFFVRTSGAAAGF